jgi:hypothetical protein
VDNVVEMVLDYLQEQYPNKYPKEIVLEIAERLKNG